MKLQAQRQRRGWRVVAAWLVAAAGWASLVATSPPSSAIEPDAVRGVALLDKEHPELRIDFQVNLTPNVLEEGSFLVNLALEPAWRSAAPEVVELGPRVVFETPHGDVEPENSSYGSYGCLLECSQGGTVVVKLPERAEGSQLFVAWTLSAGARFQTADPPPDAQLTFSATRPADSGPTWLTAPKVFVSDEAPVGGVRVTFTADRDTPEDTVWLLNPYYPPPRTFIAVARAGDMTLPVDNGVAVPLDTSTGCRNGVCVIDLYELFAEGEEFSTSDFGSWLVVAAATPNLNVSYEHLQVPMSAPAVASFVSDIELNLDVAGELVATFPDQFDEDMPPVVMFTGSGQITGVGLGKNGNVALISSSGRLAALRQSVPEFEPQSVLAHCSVGGCVARLPFYATIFSFEDTAPDATAHVAVEFQAVVVHPDTPTNLPLSLKVETP